LSTASFRVHIRWKPRAVAFGGGTWFIRPDDMGEQFRG
jgi:hypothetical protein